MSGLRQRALTVLAAIAVSVVLLGVVETALRVGGYGYPPEFFVPGGEAGGVVTNQRFGWRFFPPAVARAPAPQWIATPKPDGAYRIVVLGGSAALGTPDSAYGFGRILEAMLAETHPGARFEVVIGAMAAVNSHVVLEIGRDLAPIEPDRVLVFMGNNEVVGPHGPGSVFGAQSPSLALIRLGYRLRGLRLGQLGSGFARRLLSGDAPSAWRGLEMLSGRTVAADDPRLDAVRRHFEANLRDLVGHLGRRGIQVTLLTVPVNLRDSPPFASLHRPGLSTEELELWRQGFDLGLEHARAGSLGEAAAAFERALAIDDRHAELRFHLGRVRLALGEQAAAREHLLRARDLDALRFRADSPVNEIIRGVAADPALPGVDLLDAEAGLAAAPEVADGIPGDELFHEHVHLRFTGNYRLARIVLDRLAPELPAAIRSRRTGEAPSLETCARRLALTPAARHRITGAIVEMTSRPPFTGQFAHAETLAGRRRDLHRLHLAARSALAQAEADHRAAVERLPLDPWLRHGWALALAETGRPASAAGEWRGLLARIPGVVEWQTRLGFSLLDAGELDEGIAALRSALELSAGAPEARVNLGLGLERRAARADAETSYRHALEIDPGSEAARWNLARLLEERGQAGEALELIRQGLRLHPGSATAYRRLAEAHDRAGRLDEAAAAYRRALEIDPYLTAARNNLAYALERRQRFAEALAEYRRTVELDPAYALAWFNLADLLFALGRPAEAAPAYEAGLALDPANPQARDNLAAARHALAGAPLR